MGNTKRTFVTTPGVYIYDTFEYPENKNMFMTVIVAEIKPSIYWQDRPLLIKRVDPITAKAVNPSLMEVIEDIGMLENDTIVESINIADEIIANDTEDLVTVNGIDSIIEELINFDYEAYEASFDSGSGSGSSSRHISFIDTDTILSRLGRSTDEYHELLNSYAASYQQTVNQHVSLVDAISPEDIIPVDREKELEKLWKPLGESQDQWYGIPLINLGPRGTSLQDSYLVQLNSKDNWNVSLINSVTTGLTKDRLMIDKQIPPGVKFMLGFYMVENKYGLLLRITGDPKLYRKEINTFNDTDLVPKALSYGIDNDHVKSLVGNIWDILFWKHPTNFNYNLPSFEPAYPPGGWTYDFTKTGLHSKKVHGNIMGNTIHPIDNYGPPARVGSGPNNQDGKFVQLVPQEENIVLGFPGMHPWYFIWDSYMDNFFCRKRLNDDSFTIEWLQWLPQYPIGINNWVSDTIYSNYISYNYDTFQLTVTFNGKHYIETIMIPEKIWGHFSLRYDRINGELIFSFHDLKYNKIEKVIINIGDDLKFELISLFGRYDKDEIEYTESHQAVMGMVHIEESLRTDEDLYISGLDYGLYLNQYKPTLKQIYGHTDQEN